MVSKKKSFQPRPTILVLSSRGGNGHTAATEALQNILGERYRIVVIHPMSEVSVCGCSCGEDMYNFLLRNGWTRCINFVASWCAPTLMGGYQKKYERKIAEYLDRYQPNLVISVVPFINLAASEAARKRAIPYLLVTTDNDLTNWAYGLEKVRHPAFKITIGFDIPTTRYLLAQRGVDCSAGRVETVGLPLRASFLEKKNIPFLRYVYNVPPNKPVVLVVMGGTGGKSAYRYARALLKSNLPIHLIVCAGRDERLLRKLRRLRERGRTTFSAIGFTNKLADLMAISDLLITKAGPGTINEAFAMQLPVLVDCTKQPLFWEEANVDLVCMLGVGSRIERHADIELLVCRYVFNEECRNQVKRAYKYVPPPSFHEHIVDIVDELCGFARRQKKVPNEKEITPVLGTMSHAVFSGFSMVLASPYWKPQEPFKKSSVPFCLLGKGSVGV